jgi:predicted nucleic acid-binding protein
MNGKLIDTNILIYLSKKQLAFDKVASPGDKLFISVITYMEVLGYPFSDKTEKHIVEELCKNLLVINLDKEIVETVIQNKPSSQPKKVKSVKNLIPNFLFSLHFILITFIYLP